MPFPAFTNAEDLAFQVFLHSDSTQASSLRKASMVRCPPIPLAYLQSLSFGGITTLFLIIDIRVVSIRHPIVALRFACHSGQDPGGFRILLMLRIFRGDLLFCRRSILRSVTHPDLF